VKSFTTPEFWRQYEALPIALRRRALKNYRLWRENPQHPGLHFKRVGPNTWSARIGDDYRAVAARVPKGFVWFWIGAHKDYERLITSR
jgi:hypothetical protein